ncbi:MAG: hypothetical protein ACOY5R_09130 [Pseudomonadota bacterium]|uniref:hypothetical protein n=1 Tax=Rhizorhabdus phycosphaerae TaxID=2711156 RepID=UPI0013EA6DD5|nr:hypothetical protein [Rhizorhabdus phycosphaerae]
MKRVFIKAIAALALTSSIAVAVPAEARPGRWGYDRDYGRHWGGRDRYRWDRGYRDYGYWRGPPRRYYYGPPPRYGWGYGWAPPRRYHYRDRGGDVLLGALAGVAIGAAIADGR